MKTNRLKFFTLWFPKRFMILLAGLLCAASPNAQDRMPPIPEEALTEAQREAVEELRAVRGIEPRGPWVPLLRSPEVMRRSRAMGDYLRFNSVLPPRLSEFVILMTAREWTQQYEWQAHHDIALDEGLDPELVEAIAQGRRPGNMAEDETVIYDLHTELTAHKSISDATYARAVSLFKEQGVIDFVGIVGYYSFLAMIMNTARTPVPDNAGPHLPSLP